MRSDTDRIDNPEMFAVVPLPTAEERRRREVLLARLMLIAIDLVLSGEWLGLETARDLIREIDHTFPELAAVESRKFSALVGSPSAGCATLVSDKLLLKRDEL